MSGETTLAQDLQQAMNDWDAATPEQRRAASEYADQRATEAQMARLASDLSRMAGEPVTVERIASCYYAFGSELATLRIFAKYLAGGFVSNLNCHVGFSKNLNTHYFSLEVPEYAR